MIMITRGVGRPDRIALARSIGVPAPLDDVVDAVAAYAESGGRTVYVAQVGDRYRWSPAVRGGGYPLLRVVARFLDCPHTDITVAIQTVDGWCIVLAADGVTVDRSTVIEDLPADAAAIRSSVEERLSESIPCSRRAAIWSARGRRGTCRS